MKRTSTPPSSPGSLGSSYVRLTSTTNAARNQAPNTLVTNQSIPTLTSYEILPIEGWNNFSDALDDASWIDTCNFKLTQQGREERSEKKSLSSFILNLLFYKYFIDSHFSIPI